MAFSSVMTECGKIRPSLQERVLAWLKSKGLQQKVNRAWDNQTWCQWRKKDSLGKLALLIDTDLLITFWIRSCKHKHGMVRARGCHNKRTARTGEGLLTRQRRYEQFHLLALVCVLSLSFMCDSFLKKNGWLGWHFQLHLWWGFFCMELAGFVLWVNRSLQSICCILVFVVELKMDTVC